MNIRHVLIAATFTIATATALPSWAATYYVAPKDAKLTCATPDGSKACPWASVSKGLASKKIVGGDTILLMDGDHGELRLNATFDKDVTIQSENGRKARLTYAHFSDAARHIRLKNLSIWRNEGDAGFLVRSYKGATFLTFEGLDVRSRKDATERLNWTAERWRSVNGVGGNGFELRGSNYVVRNCKVIGTWNGIIGGGANGLVENNIVDGFIGDGLKSGGNNGTFRNNLIINRFKVSDTHADGFQAYKPTTMFDLTVESNIIIEWTYSKSHPLRGFLQGIGLFDGMYENLLIQNNVVATTPYNGLAVLGARNARIINNTIVNLDGRSGVAPWLRISASKSGERSQNVLISNNLAMRIGGNDAKNAESNKANNIVYKNNSVILYPTKVIQDLAKFNFAPRIDSGYVDTGDKAFAPKTDVLGNKRPTGVSVDRGAYEVGTGTKSAVATFYGSRWVENP